MGSNPSRCIIEPMDNVDVVNGVTSCGRIFGAATKSSHEFIEDGFSILSEDGISIFSIFDGHGGYESSKFCRDNFNRFFMDRHKNVDNFSNNERINETFELFDQKIISFLENEVKGKLSKPDLYSEKAEIPSDENEIPSFRKKFSEDCSKNSSGCCGEIILIIDSGNNNTNPNNNDSIEIISLHVGDSGRFVPTKLSYSPQQDKKNPKESSSSSSSFMTMKDHLCLHLPLVEKERLSEAGGELKFLMGIPYCGRSQVNDWDGHPDDFFFQMTRSFGNPEVKDYEKRERMVHLVHPFIERQTIQPSKDIDPEESLIVLFSDGAIRIWENDTQISQMVQSICRHNNNNNNSNNNNSMEEKIEFYRKNFWEPNQCGDSKTFNDYFGEWENIQNYRRTKRNFRKECEEFQKKNPKGIELGSVAWNMATLSYQKPTIRTDYVDDSTVIVISLLK